MKKRVFVSDTHMTPGSSLAGSTGVYDWFTKKTRMISWHFSKYVRGDASFDEVILLGDIMDVWLCPYDVPPPSYAEARNARPTSILFYRS